MDKKTVIDLTTFLSNDTCQMLTQAGILAKDSKHTTIDVPHVVFMVISYDKKVQQVLESIAQLDTLTTATKQQLTQHQKWIHMPDKLFLSKELRHALISALLESVNLKENLISPLGIMLALAKLGYLEISYETLVKTLNLTQGMAIGKPTPQQQALQIAQEVTTTDPQILKTYIDRPVYTDQIIRLLYKENKKNIFLIGNDGIGKDATKFLLAKKAHEPNNVFSHSRIFSLNISRITAVDIGHILDELQEKADEFEQTTGKILLYLENVEISENESYKESSLINPLLEKLLASKIWGIFPINYTQYQNLIRAYPNLINKSELITMEEPDVNTAIAMASAHYTAQTAILSPETIKTAVQLARRYIHDQYLPENALSILDEAVSQARIENQTSVSADTIKSILSQKTGIPLTDISQEEATDLQHLEDILRQTVIGQDQAIEAVARTIKRSRAGLKDPKRPIGSFLFLGPSGTGKTQLAKAIAKSIYKDENAMIRLDMSEYTDAHTVDRLIGAPPGYVGYEEGGQLTNKVLKKPYSLILLDEVEKANPKVFDIFLQVLDDGRLTDGQGKTVDFKNTIVIMTSNLQTEEELTQFFRTEFLNRIDQVIRFNQLSVENGKAIVRLFIKDLQARLAEKDISLSVDENVINNIATTGITAQYGARPLRRMVEEKIEDPIVEKLISGEIKPGQTLTWNHI